MRPAATRLFLVLSLLTCTPLAAMPQGDWLNHPRCPTVDTTVSWIDYLTERIPRKPPSYLNLVTIEFSLAKALGDAAIGGIDTKYCYNVGWLPEARFGRRAGYSTTGNHPRSSIRETTGHPGDPRQHEINVNGVLLMFNDAGEVFDHRGRVVGYMSCYRSSHRCQNY